MDGEKRVGTQHYSMVLANGQEAILKQGDRVPIATSGTVNSAMPGSTQAQFVYQDIGMTFGATLSELHEGARLRTDVVQTSLATEKPAFTAPDPVIRQTEFKGEAVLSAGKPLVLGSMDIPGSTRHFQIEALIEPLP
jgi:type II secretory pathway component GspD/PulD (secretin)